MGSKKTKKLKDFVLDVGDQGNEVQVVSKDGLRKMFGGTTHQVSQGNQGCSGIVPQ